MPELTQASPSAAPIQDRSTLRRNEELLARIRKARNSVVHRVSEEENSFGTSAREMVRHFLSALAPSPTQPNVPVSKDIANLRKAIGSIMTAADEKILSDEEANAVINFIVQRFVERRFDEVLQHVATPQTRGWFAVGRHVYDQEES